MVGTNLGNPLGSLIKYSVYVALLASLVTWNGSLFGTFMGSLLGYNLVFNIGFPLGRVVSLEIPPLNPLSHINLNKWGVIYSYKLSPGCSYPLGYYHILHRR